MLLNVSPLDFASGGHMVKFVEEKSKSLVRKLIMVYLKNLMYLINEFNSLRVYRACHILGHHFNLL
jgi:hypothetical protein